eukprot:5223996-Amphidinium_carterae.1
MVFAKPLHSGLRNESGETPSVWDLSSLYSLVFVDTNNATMDSASSYEQDVICSYSGPTRDISECQLRAGQAMQYLSMGPRPLV